MQSPGRGTLLLAVLTLLLAAAAAGQTPSHPLSQISPSDTGLNLSDNTNAAPHNLSGTNWVVPAGSSLHVAGDLDLQGNSLQDYFGTACSGGEAVADVNNDGTFSCVSISGTSANVYVNESGDVMTGDLNMSRNTIRNIGSNRTNFTASGRLDMGEIIDMNSNRIRNVQDPTSSQDAVTQGYAGTEYLTRTTSDSMQGDLDMLGHSIVNVDSLGNGTARTIAIDADGNVYIGNGMLSLSQALADGNVSDTITIASGGSVDTGALSGTVTNQVRTGFLSTDTALSTGNITDAYVLNTGDTMTGDLDMEGNRVHDIGGGSTNITTSGRLDVGGLIDVTDHRVRNIANATASQDAVPLSQLQGDYVARSGDSMTGNLDMVDNNITNVFHLSGYFEGSCGEGKAVKDVFDNGTVNCGDAGAGLPSTLNINNSAHKYDINMDDQNISNLPDPIASSQPTSLGFANSRYLTRQTSDSMQGDLDMLGNDITNVDRIGNGSYPVNVTSELQMSEHNITTDTGDNLTIGTDVKIYGKVWLPGGGTGGGGALAAENLSQTLEAGNSAFKYDIDMNGQNISNLPDPIGSGQPVTLGFGDSRYLNRDGSDSMSGNLDLSGYNLQNVDEIGNGSTPTAFTSAVELRGNALQTAGGTITLRDTANSQDLLTAAEGGPVEVPSTTLLASSMVNISSSGALQLNVRDTDFDANDQFQLRTGDSATNADLRLGYWDDSSPSFTEHLRLERGGPVEVRNADLNLPGSNDIQSGGTDAIQLDGSQNVEVPNGNLKASGGDVNVTTHNVTSQDEICIGDQCT